MQLTEDVKHILRQIEEIDQERIALWRKRERLVKRLEWLGSMAVDKPESQKGEVHAE
ncbi:MAG: hypothetical protein ACOCQT_00210 [Desulfovermiculus sp.]